VMLLMVSAPARPGVVAAAGAGEPPVRGDADSGAGAAAETAPARASPPSPTSPTARSRRALRALRAAAAAGLRAQLVASFGLLPVALVAFQQVAVVGLLANLVAVPWVTLVVTPLALAGVLLPPLWTLAAAALKPLLAWLALLAALPLASLHVAVAPAWAVVAGLAGGALLLLPLPWRVRALGLPMVLPLLLPPLERPPPGRFELVAADVGQGSAVLVRTASHLLLFDTGPRFAADSDAGRRMLLPLLQARGERRIDLLVLSHRDADHVGGAQALLDRLPVGEVRSSLEDGHPLRRGPVPHRRCLAGQRWRWDGVDFEFLHPTPADFTPGAKPNALSCVLRVADAGGHAALLTGDIEMPQEAALVARAGAALRSEILLVPHHGSRTSSSGDFIDAVGPAVAVIQVGYRSRYGHPVPEVVARFPARGIAVVRTDHCGAWQWREEGAHCTREVRRRYWHWTQAGPPPDQPAVAGSVVATLNPVPAERERVTLAP